MVKNHLKRIFAPKTWNIERKEKQWITRPNPGAHDLMMGMSLDTVMRTMAKVAKTERETKFIVSTKDVLVDKKKRKDRRHMVGFMDVIEFPHIKETFRILLDEKGRLVATKITDDEAATKISRIESKRKVKGGKTQITLFDGRNLLVTDNTYSVGDSLQIELPTQKIQNHYPLTKGTAIYLLLGKHAGKMGNVEEINKGKLIFSANGEKYETLAKYAYPVGKQKPALACLNKKQ
jgi:small subunit ribosomal protein S4e